MLTALITVFFPTFFGMPTWKKAVPTHLRITIAGQLILKSARPFLSTLLVPVRSCTSTKCVPLFGACGAGCGVGFFWKGVVVGLIVGGFVTTTKSLRIVTVAEPTAIVPPPVGLEMLTVKSRSGPAACTGATGMLIVWLLAPGANVSVPLVAV